MSYNTTDLTPRGSRDGAPASPDKPPASRRGWRYIGAVLASSIVLAALMLVLANLAFAQSAQKKAPPAPKPYMVEDIYPGATGSEPNNLFNFKGTLLFSANHPDFGEELWRSEGTERNTKLVKDIDPGPLMINDVENTETGSSAPDKVLRTKKWIYFAATTVKYGEELWKSDGTERGTKLVKDINITDGNSNPNDNSNLNDTRSAEVEKLFVVGKTLYFRASDGTDNGKHGVELWKSDGTEAGTTLVKDINPAPPAATGTTCKRAKNCAGSSWADDMTLVNGKVYFTANDGANGVELWRTDGTEAGTTLVKDVNPEPYKPATARASDIANLVAVGRTLYFSANDGTNGLELWKSNGTEAGTTLVKDINPGPADSDPDQLTEFKGRLLFRADDGVHGSEMWRSNGTEAGTQLLLDIEPGPVGSEPGELTTSGPFLFFSASNPSAGEELWAVSTKRLIR